MNHNVKIISIGENEYRVSGTVIKLQEYYKTVTVDGDDYHKTWREEVLVDIDKSWDSGDTFRWYCTEIDDFQIIGLPIIKLWNYSNAYYFIKSRTARSENEYVNMCQILSDIGIIPFEIWAGKSSAFEDIKDGVVVNIYSYGFNNSMSVVLTYQDILRLNIPEGKYLYKYKDREYFPKGWQKFNDSQKSDLLINFINKLNDRL